MSDLLRDAIRHYEDLLADKHLASTREALAKCESRVLRPQLVTRADYDRLLHVTTLLNRAVVTAADRLAKDEALRRKIGIPPYMDKLIDADREHGFPSVMARFDGLIDRNGAYQAIEYNSLPGFNEGVTTAFASLPIAQEFGQRYAFRTTDLVELAGKVMRSREDDEAVAVVAVPVTSLPASPEKYPRQWWVRQSEGRHYRIVEATLDEFRHENGKLVIARDGGIVVDLVMPNWEDINEWAGQPLALMEAIRAGSVRTLGGVSRGLLCGYKHTFELLSNPEYAAMFEPEVAAALAKHIPWTRAVSNRKTTYKGRQIDLLPFVAESRDRWVLKPSGGSSGAGVLLGHTCTDAVWRQTLKRALQQKYVIQERVFGAIESVPFAAKDGGGIVIEETTPTFEPFVWRGTTPADAIVRLSATGNHTLGTDGVSTSALWILESV